MAKRRQAAILLMVVCLVLVTLTLAFPAAGDPVGCPKGWDAHLNGDGSGSARERNENFVYCSKQVNGTGNNGDGRNFKDDGPH
jgi:hypothetical protein